MMRSIPAILCCLSALPSLQAYDTVVTFNEINYHPAGTGAASEWVELRNQNGVNVDLSGWRLSSGVEYRIPNGTVIPGNGYLVIAADPATSGLAGALGPWTGQLDNGGETLRLRDNNDRIMDEVAYGDGGDWPLAPDGSGATLCKRSGDGSSESATAWTFSTQAGGTPGSVNFPPPPTPVTTTPVTFHSPWKYNNSGNDPGSTWKNPGYNDTTAPWQSGEAFFGYGGARVFQPGLPATGTGIWNQAVWTGNADSGIASTRTYTHKIGLNRSGSFTTINGVTFTAPGSGITGGANWSLTGATSAFTNNGNGNGANNLTSPSGSRELCTEFFYGANDNGKSRLTLTGLTAGQAYTVRFYTTGFGAPGDRLMTIIPSDTGRGYLCDENATDSGNGQILSYRYMAPAGGSITFDFVPTVAGNTWHHYAFSNETAAAASQEFEITGVTATAFSSQLTTGFTRQASNTVNGSGLTGGQHGVTADGTMWLTTGTFSTPNDPLPADITWDLGAATDLTSLHVWNYNEASFNNRGARLVEILTASSPGGPFTSRGTFTLFKASGRATEPGQQIDLNLTNVRQVKFNLTANHGDTAQLTGLSEVKFYRPGIPGEAVPVPYRERIASLYNSGTGNDRQPLTVGSTDPHYTNSTNGAPVIAMSPHPAWLGDDGVSRFIGLSGAGTDSVAAGTLTYRTIADFTGYDPASALIGFYAAADNNLDSVKLNGTTVAGVNGAGFSAYLGPFNVSGPFLPGNNQFDIQWTNLGPDVNPGGIRIKWDATAAPDFTRTTLAANPVTTWFRNSFTLTGPVGSTWTGVLRYALDDGAVFYLNGTEIHRTNLSGIPAAATPAETNVAYPLFSTFTVPAGLLQDGTNLLAVELHQATAGSADALFGCSLTVTGTPPAISSGSLKVDKVSSATATTFSLDLRNDSGSTLNLGGYSIVSSSGGVRLLTGTPAGGAWLPFTEVTLGFRPLDGDKLFLLGPGSSILDAVTVKNREQARTVDKAWKTPSSYQSGGQALFSIPDSIVINEIMYHHAPVFLPTGSTSNPEEWIELTNKSTAPVSLDGWKIRGAIDYDFTSTTLAPNSYLVVSGHPPALAAKYPAITIAGPFTGSLSNKGDTLRIEDPAGNTIDEVHYQTGGRWDRRADGGGSSLELKNPTADNSVPESWVASNESAKALWQTYTWTGTGAAFTGTNDPTTYNEFILGLLNDGTCLVDDISVKEVSSANRGLIQNGGFASNTAASWRLLGNHGTHGLSFPVDDPASPGNKVLKITATGATEHMHNHCETTLKAGSTFVPLSATSTYTISFRARWVSGCPRLNARLYFNRLAKTVLLPIPENTGTPGAPNSQFTANPGPSLTQLSHSPAVPAAGTPVTVSIHASAPDGLASVNLKWRQDGAATWNVLPMAGGADLSAVLPGQASAALVEFYVEATGNAGGVSRYPADSALVKWNDGIVPPGPGHGFRLLMTTANANLMHDATNVMSNDTLPCTVIYREDEIFYNTRCRLKSSERGRQADVRLGFAIDFDPLQPFRGKNLTVNLDRSSYGRGTTGSGYGQSDIFNWHFFNRAGGISSMYNDLVYLISPRSAHTGSAALTMAEFNDGYLDGQWANGAGTPTFKYELIYYPTTTTTGGPEGLKIPQPDDVLPVSIGQIGNGTSLTYPAATPPDKEPYRWNFLIGNGRSDDDYNRLIDFNTVFRQNGATYLNNLPKVIDVDQWLRGFAALSLAGVGDHYSSAGGGWHNLKLYQRADGRILMLPWDHDFLSEPFDAPIVRAPDLSKMISASPAWHRAFYGHLHDIISKSFNPAYTAPWATHYQSFTTTGGNWGDITTYVNDRMNFVLADCNTQYPATAFAITTNGGNAFSTANPVATLAGTAWINVTALRVQGNPEPLALTWTSRTAWQVTLPVDPGPNAYTIEGLNYDGTVVATDTITITGTGLTVPASSDNLVVSEINYNPLPPTPAEISAGFTDNNDFEFIELRNIAATSVTLTGVRFTDGILWSAPAGTSIPAGGAVIIPRRSAAFALRYPGIATLPQYYQVDANQLRNGGENLTLTDAAGGTVKQFSYDNNAPWPTPADGPGRTLVLVAPGLNPDHNFPQNWRASTADKGNPGSSDAAPFPANPNGDDDQDGLPNLVDYFYGPTGGPGILVPNPGGLTNTLDLTYTRAANSSALAAPELSPDLLAWTPSPSQLLTRTPNPDGSETLTIRITPTTPLGTRHFVKLRITGK
jgi:hypothetical protein